MSGEKPKVRAYRMPGRSDLYALRFDPGARKWQRRSTGMRTEAAAIRVGVEWRKEGEAIETGEAPATAALRRRTLEEHVLDFLESKRTDPRQFAPESIADVESCLRRVIVASGWTRIVDVTLDGMQAILARLPELFEAAEGGKRRRGRRAAGGVVSNGRLNHYRAAWKGFTRWAHRTGRIDFDALAAMPKWRTEGYETFKRRALSVDEFGKLFDATMVRVEAGQGSAPEGRAGREAKSSDWSKRSGSDRATAYLVAVSTGFRLGSIAKLPVSAFALDGELPVVVVEAKAMKSRREKRQPILPDAVGQLRRWLSGRSRNERPFGWLKDVDAAEMIRADLAAAGVSLVDADGRRLDFHSLRHTYGTWLTTVLKLPPKAAQLLMGHSSMDLTMKLYTHLNDSDLKRQMGVGVGISRYAGAARSDHTTRDHTGPEGADESATSIANEGVARDVADGLSSAPQPCDPPNKPPPEGPGAERSRWDSNPRITDLQSEMGEDRTDSKSVETQEVARCAGPGATPALRADAEDDPEPPVRAPGRRRSARERADAGDLPSADRAIAALLGGLKLMGVRS